MPESLFQMIASGTLLEGRYTIEHQIGKGGMGAVYKAHDQRLSKPVALKQTIVPEHYSSQALENEAKILASLNHPSLVHVIDYFSCRYGKFIVMNFIEGDDIGAIIQKRNNKPLDEKTVLAWADQILDALEYIHGQDPPIIHRDIKPQNIKLTKEQRIILLDFGLAKGAFQTQRGKKTVKSTFGYTPNYAPHEQVFSMGTEPRSDLFSFGATLYHLVTGSPPELATVRFQALEKKQTDPLTLIPERNPSISQGLAQIIHQALAIHIDDRPRTAADMRKYLRSHKEPKTVFIQDIYTRYEKGVNFLLLSMGVEHPRYKDALIYEQRLMENILEARAYGDNSTRKSSRVEIMNHLNNLALEVIGESFNQLCHQADTKQVAKDNTSPATVSLRSHLATWIQATDFDNGIHQPSVPNARSAYYLPNSSIQNILELIYHNPYYHIIEAEMGMGKTSFVEYLWYECQNHTKPVIAYLFSRQSNRTNVQGAIKSLHLQLDHLLGSSVMLHGHSQVLSYQALQATSEKYGHLMVLIDGMDECDPLERKQFRLLFPPTLQSSITWVITTRPRSKDIVWRHLPEHHMLRTVKPQSLPLFTEQDIATLFDNLQVVNNSPKTIQLINDDALIRQIAIQSKGKPLWIYLFCDAVQRSEDPFSVIHKMSASWDWVLEDMQNLCTQEHRAILDSMLSILMVAKSGLTLAELTEILDQYHSSQPCRHIILDIHEAIRRYLPKDDNGLVSFFDSRFEEYFQELGDYKSEITKARKMLCEKVAHYSFRSNLDDVPLYVLRQAPACLARFQKQKLPDLLIRREWFDELQKRTNSRAECIDSIMDAWQVIQTLKNTDESFIYLVACAIVRTSLTATLLPELVLKLVVLGIWTTENAHDYARFYELADNRRVVLEGLENGVEPSFPEGSAAAQAAASLDFLLKLSPKPSPEDINAWIRNWELVTSDTKRLVVIERLELLLEEFRSPFATVSESIEGNFVRVDDFPEILDELEQYVPPPTGSVDDPVFEDLMIEISDICITIHSNGLLPRSKLHKELYKILEVVSKNSQVDLLRSLEILAPAIRSVFSPDVVIKMCSIIENTVTAYIPLK